MSNITNPPSIFLAFWAAYDDDAYGENVPLACVLRLDRERYLALREHVERAENAEFRSLVLPWPDDAIRWIKKVGFLSDNSVAPIDGFMASDDILVAPQEFLNAEIEAEADFMDACEEYQGPVQGVGFEISMLNGSPHLVPVGHVDFGHKRSFNYCGIFQEWRDIAPACEAFFAQVDGEEMRSMPIASKWKEIAVLHHIDFYGAGKTNPAKLFDELGYAGRDAGLVEQFLGLHDACVNQRYDQDSLDSVARYIHSMAETMAVTERSSESSSVQHEGLVVDATEKATIQAALTHYLRTGQGDPFNRSDELHSIATADDDVISMDGDGIQSLLQKVAAVPAVVPSGEYAAPEGARRFYETSVVVRVLSEDDSVAELSLAEIAHQIENGDCVGVIDMAAREISPRQAATRLMEMGSEVGFFGLDDADEAASDIPVPRG